MRYAVFGDIHANLEGLEAVLEALNAEHIDHYICTGDIVGYGASPNECCAVLRELGATCLFGNHDQACLGMVDLRWFNAYARAAAYWTANHLVPEHREWLAALPPTRIVGPLMVVHSSLPDPWKWIYVTTPALAADTMDACDTQVIFVGHTHIAEAYRRLDGRPVDQASLRNGGLVNVEEHVRYLVNPGSCGQPRDLNPQVAFAVYDTEARRIVVRRVPYDVERAAGKILRAGLPSFLAQRLLLGR